MAINPQKFLPPARLGSSLTKVSKKVISTDSFSNLGSSKISKDIGVIKIKVIQIENILKGTIAAEKKALDEKKRLESSKRRERQEEKLETKKQPEKGEIKTPKVPRMGFLDWIKNFIGNVLLGYFAVRMLDFLPKIKPIIGFLGSAADFVIDVGGKLLNGLVSFIDWGYKAIDFTKGMMKSLGGEGAEKAFDGFMGAIGNLVETAIIAAAVIGSMGDGGGEMGTTGIRGAAGQVGRSRYGTSAAAARRYAERFGVDAARKKFGSNAVKSLGGKYARSGATNLARKGLVGLAGKGGAKVILGTVRPLLKRLPIIGALIDFGLSVALGEDPGRAAFKSIGAALLGSIGAAVGSLAFGFGGIVGGILGSIGGDAIGGALYDMFFGGKKPQQKNQKVQKKAGGGITRGGKSQTGARRTIGGKKKYKRQIVRKPGEVEIKPGADVGGEDKIFGIFPNPLKAAQKVVDAVNPFNVVKSAGENLGKTDYFGPILAITSKITLGQKPSQKDYENVGLGINMLIAKGIQEKQLKGGIVAAFADGGLVDPDVLSAAETGGDISNWVAKTFQGEIESNAQKTLRLIKENTQKKKQQQDQPAPSADDMGLGDGVQVSSDSEDFWLLATAAMFENSNPQGAADVAQVIYNRTQYPAWNAPTIRKAILNPGQFQPVRQYGGTNAWASIKTKEDALRFSKTHRKTQEQLERVAAALLDKEKQNNARSFVGPRDSFRAEAYEKANDHLADDTEKSRHGHTFGFEPGGAMIGQFKAGKLSAAQVNANITGNVNLKPGDGSFIQGNSGRSGGTHFHIGTNKPGDGSGVASAGFNVIKHFLGKKSVYVGRSGETIPANATDEQIRGYIGRGQAAHRQTELDLQIGGLGAGNKVAFPLALKNMKYSDTDGYGVSADIVGTNAFVGHGRYKPDGSLAPQQKLVLNMGAPDYYAFHGKSFGIVPKNGLTLRLHPGEMYKVIDKDSVDLLGYDLTKDIISIENKAQLVAKAPSIIERLKSISGYTDYEQPYAEPQVIEVPVEVPVPMGDYQSSGGGVTLIPFGGGDDPFETLYKGG